MEIASKVVIKECHSLPQLVGKKAKVVAIADPQVAKYPFTVILVDEEEPVTFETPLGGVQTRGPFGFREDELELVDESPEHGIPEAFLKQ